MSKNLKYILIAAIALFIFLGIIMVPKYLRALEIQEKMKMEYIEDTFINMDQYFDSQTVQKSVNPYIFPRKENISLPRLSPMMGRITTRWTFWTLRSLRDYWSCRMIP